MLRVAPVESVTSLAGSKSSGVPSLICEPALTHAGGPFAVLGAESANTFAPLSPSPAKSRKPCALLGARAEFTSPVDWFTLLGKSVVNSNVFVIVCTGRFSVTNANVYGVSALPPKSWMLFVTWITSSALSGNSPNTGVSVNCVVNWSCLSENTDRTRRAGVVAVPLPHDVGELGAVSWLGTKPFVTSPVAYW